MTKIVPPVEESFGPDKNELEFFMLRDLALERRTGNFTESLRDIYISEFEEVIAKKTGLQKKRLSKTNELKSIRKNEIKNTTWRA